MRPDIYIRTKSANLYRTTKDCSYSIIQNQYHTKSRTQAFRRGKQQHLVIFLSHLNSPYSLTNFLKMLYVSPTVKVPGVFSDIGVVQTGRKTFLSVDFSVTAF